MNGADNQSNKRMRTEDGPVSLNRDMGGPPNPYMSRGDHMGREPMPGYLAPPAPEREREREKKSKKNAMPEDPYRQVCRRFSYSCDCSELRYIYCDSKRTKRHCLLVDMVGSHSTLLIWAILQLIRNNS